MPVERRLRQGLERNASALEPDVARFMDAVVTRTRRRARVRKMATGFAVVAITIVCIAVGPRALDALRDLGRSQPANDPTPTLAPRGQVLIGTYTRRVDRSPAIDPNKMAGRWTVELRRDGTMIVTAPPAFTGVLSGTVFQTDARQFRTGLFGQDVCSFQPLGTYRWSRSGDRLSFNVEDDQCEARVEFFASGTWRRAS